MKDRTMGASENAHDVDVERTAARSGGSIGGHIDTTELYGLLVESVRDYAIFALDPKGFILTWNAGAERIKGYRRDEIVGKHLSTFYEREDVERGKIEWELDTAASEGRFEDEGWRIRKDGSRFWANIVITALRDDRGVLAGFAKVTRDLTERRAAQERAIADARRIATAETASRVKSEFLATLSHELRTPLNAVGGYAELIALGVYGPVTRDQRDALQRIANGKRHLLRIINDLLNYSRIEAGRVECHLARFPVSEVIERSIQMVTPQAAAKAISVTAGPQTTDVIAWADAAKVDQIMLNLLSNAAKFTPAGGRVRISSESSQECILIHVSDTGPGIPPDQIAAIFEPFVQLGRSLTSPQEGAGLGLAISRDLARAMGGDLSVVNGAPAGATFTLELPRAKGIPADG
jgi:PAS domain S-box-containing protein